MVKNLIMRYANDNNNETSELLNKFGIPQKWVYQSMALKNKYSVIILTISRKNEI